MCGIAGVMKWTAAQPPRWQTDDPAVLTRMAACIAHRGPDGQGIWTDPRPGRTLALVHQRLAVIDLPLGSQPMPNEDGRVQVVFNGEIYNHADLRRELTAAGHRFASDHSDTEVLVHGWEQWREKLPEKLTGMFAFAIWDSAADTLFLARDRMGQKPLFYAILEDGIVFGSTIPAVLAWPEVPRRIPREQIALYLQLGYVPPPGTIYRDVSQVMPGHWVRVQRDVLYGERYWHSKMFFRDPAAKYRLAPEADLKRELRDRITAAVHSQLLADVPVACFLSGGIDSSIIASLMQQHVAARGGPAIRTVSVGFGESDFDETRFAQTIADTIGSHHTRLEVNVKQDVPGTLQYLLHHVLGQPFGDSSLLPTYHLSKAVRGMATVALSGDGADELFGGYDRYRAMEVLPQYRWALRHMPPWLPVGSLRRRERLRRMVHAANAPGLSEAYTRLVGIFSLPHISALLDIPDESLLPWAPTPAELDAPDYISPLRMAMLRDQREYLPGDVLWKVDSASMAVALEVRSPFLDHRVVESANSLWEIVLIGQGMGKFLLRETFEDLLPEAVRTRGKKGFGVPIGHWFRGPLRNFLHDTLAAPTPLSNLLRRPAVDRLLAEHHARRRDHTHRLFTLLMLQLWAAAAQPRVE